MLGDRLVREFYYNLQGYVSEECNFNFVAKLFRMYKYGVNRKIYAHKKRQHGSVFSNHNRLQQQQFGVHPYNILNYAFLFLFSV